jgi:hypothetical protein
MVERAPHTAHDELAIKRLLAAHGGCFSQSTVVDLMGLKNASTIDRWREHRQIIAVRDEAEEWVFPIWQFAKKQRRVMLGIRDCLAELAFEDESEPVTFFLSNLESLGGHTPLDRLRAGKIEAAIMAARYYASGIER